MFGNGVHRDVRGAVLVAITIAAPVVPTLLLTGGSSGSAEVLHSSELVAYALVLGAAVFVYFHWRMTSSAPARENANRLAGWLTIGLLVAGIYGLVQASVLDTAGAAQKDSWPLLGLIVLQVVLIVVARVAERAEVPGDPAVAGAVGGLLLTAIACIVLGFAPPLVVSPTIEDLLVTMVMVTGLLLALTLLQRTEVSTWVRRRLALSAVLLTAAHCAGYLDIHRDTVVTVAVIANLQGAVVLCTMAQSLLRKSVLEHQRELQQLQQTLAQVRANVLEDRELLHEVGSTVAGITTASRVMRQGPLLSPQRRQRLERMLNAELARLDRLMSSRAPSVTREFDVDDVVEQLVTSHHERGLDVHWTPGYAYAFGDPDDLAEVVNILLENSRRHGGGKVQVDVTASDEYVEVTCSDDGPGVADEVRHQLFTSGVRGPESPGEGLGLAIARRLMSDRGGSLELTASRHHGATFVARLPISMRTHVASHHVA
jgi:signal transduction histidine kinase